MLWLRQLLRVVGMYRSQCMTPSFTTPPLPLLKSGWAVKSMVW